jgi:hypothetical protein
LLLNVLRPISRLLIFNRYPWEPISALYSIPRLICVASAHSK